VVQDELVVAFGDYAGTYRQTGKSVTAPFAHLWTVKGEKIASFLTYTDTAKILEALTH
jgi:ketosteroid isomerase-like protein